MSRPTRAAASFLAILAALAGSPAFAASLRMEAVTTWAENISRAASPANWIDALRQEAHVTASHLQPLATGLSLLAEGDAGFEAVPRYQLNTMFAAGATVQLRKKFGLGAFAPVLAAEVGLRRREARLAADASWSATGALRFSQRFTDQWRASLAGDWRQHYASHSTFDIRHHRLIGSVTWDLTDRWQLTYGRGSLWGDFVANASSAVWSRALAGLISPAIGAYYNTVSWEVTDAYGPGWVSYRVTGRSDFWWLELAPALGRNTSLPLRYESTFTKNLVGVTYRQDLWTLGVLHRF
jgi:hypothetical protein